MKQLEREGLHVQVQARLIAGDSMVASRRADALSRVTSTWYNFAMRMQHVHSTLQQLQLQEHNMVDLFCEGATARFSLKVTFTETAKDRLWTNACSRSWNPQSNTCLDGDMVLWVFPPPRQLPRAFEHWAKDSNNLDMVLVHPTSTRFANPAMWQSFVTQRVALPPLHSLLFPPEGWNNNEEKSLPSFQLLAAHSSHGREKRH